MQIKDANLDINYKDIELQCNLSKSRNGHKMEDQIKFCLDFLLLAVCFLRKLFCLETDLGRCRHFAFIGQYETNTNFPIVLSYHREFLHTYWNIKMTSLISS